MPRTRKGGEWEKNSSQGMNMVYSQKNKSNQKQLGKPLMKKEKKTALGSDKTNPT